MTGSQEGASGDGPSLDILVGIQDTWLNGVDVYAEQVAVAALAAGHRVTLAVTDAEVATNVRPRLDPNVEILDLAITRPSLPAATAGRFLTMVELSHVCRAAERLLSGGRTYDVLHLNRPALAPGLRHRARITTTGAWFHPPDLPGRIRETWHHTGPSVVRRALHVGRGIDRWYADERGFRACDRVMAPTPSLAAALEARGVRAVLCPPPIGLPVPADAALPERTGRSLLVVCGDLSHPRKNVAEALRAAAALAACGDDWVLTLVGRNAAAVADSIPVEPHLDIRTPGQLPPADVQALMAAADVLVLPSRYEEWGYVAVESMLAGTPVAAYPVYPFADMLGGGLGCVAAASTPAALARAIEGALGGVCPTGELLREEAIRRFGSAAVGDRLTAAWRDALGQG